MRYGESFEVAIPWFRGLSFPESSELAFSPQIAAAISPHLFLICAYFARAPLILANARIVPRPVVLHLLPHLAAAASFACHYRPLSPTCVHFSFHPLRGNKSTAPVLCCVFQVSYEPLMHNALDIFLIYVYMKTDTYITFCQFFIGVKCCTTHKKTNDCALFRASHLRA